MIPADSSSGQLHAGHEAVPFHLRSLDFDIDVAGLDNLTSDQLGMLRETVRELIDLQLMYSHRSSRSISSEMHTRSQRQGELTAIIHDLAGLDHTRLARRTS